MISVIIPVFNTEVFIDKCLDSIQSQTYTNWECILVNDCSTDSTVEHIKKYLIDSRFRLVQMDKNSGPGSCRNVGIDLAEGDWLTFIDSDDFIDENYFATMLSKANKDVDLIGIGHWRIGGVGNIKRNQVDICPGTYIDKEPPKMTYVWDKMYRTLVIKDNDIKFPPVMSTEDVIFNQKFWSFCRRAEIIDKRMYYHRVYVASLSKSADFNNRLMLTKVKEEHLNAIEWLRKRKKKLIHDQRGRLQRRIEKYYSGV